MTDDVIGWLARDPGGARPILGQDLIVAADGFAGRIQQGAKAVLDVRWEEMWDGKQPFSFTVGSLRPKRN